MQELFAQGKEFLLYPRGESMLPLIRQGEDGVYLCAPKDLRRKDVCLYRRENGQFVLHRLIKLEKDGTLSFRGDNQSVIERGIPRDAVLARVSAVLKGQKRISPKGRIYLLTHCSAPARLLRFGKI